MAVAYMMGLDPTRARAVRTYFRRYNTLPPRSLYVTTPTVPPGPPSLETLLRTMVRQGAANYMLVAHGDPNGLGLFLKLTHLQGTSPGTRFEFLAHLLKMHARKSGGVTKSDQSIMKLNAKSIERLLNLMRAVHKTKIGWIEFRGCNLGRNTQSLETFRRFFGARHIGAPDRHTFFGLPRVGASANLFQNHRAQHAGNMETYTTRFSSGEECHCCMVIGADGKPHGGHVVAERKDTVTKWIGQKFGKPTDYSGREIPIHGVWRLAGDGAAGDPLAAIGGGRPEPIWPRDKRYGKHIIYRHGPRPK